MLYAISFAGQFGPGLVTHISRVWDWFCGSVLLVSFGAGLCDPHR